MANTIDLGLVTAYGNAKEGGYTGTEAQFNTLLANLPTYATNAQNYSIAAAQSAQDAEDAADRAQAIVGGEFVSYGQTQGLTDAQKTLARKNIGAVASNPNLLDNGWFQINQRGATAGTYTNAYAVDRWKLGGTVKVTSIGAYFGVKNESGAAVQIFQMIEGDYVGKKVTLSLKDYDGTIHSKTFVVSASNQWLVLPNSWRIGVNAADGVLAYRIYATGDVTAELKIVACKMEWGEVSTLAFDEAPDKLHELAKCRQYLRVIKTSATIQIAQMYGVSAARCDWIGYDGNNPMRDVAASSNVSVTYTGNLYLTGGGQQIAITSVAPVLSGNQHNLIAYVDNGLTQSAMYSLMLSGTLIISHEM